jgi:signal transduction histidine kinase
MSSRSSSSWPSRLEWGIILAFWGLFALLSIGQDAVGDNAALFHWGKAAGELIEYGTWVLLTPLIFRFVAAFPVVEGAPDRAGRPLRNSLLHVGVAFFVAIAIDLSEELLELFMEASAASTAPLLQQVQRLWFLDELMFYLVVLMAGFARIYYLEKQERQAEAERLEARAEALEAQLTEARLDALRMQLNPHFLFNTLHAVSTLVDRDPDGVRRMIARLSELLRHVLDEDAPQEVPLADELDFLDDYLDIQSIRFQGALDTTIDVPSALHDAQVPHLILQPVVENAIKHGASQVRGIGRIDVRAHRDDDRLVLTVQDNGPGLDTDQADGLGLRNVRARLQALYGDDHTVRFDTPPDAGTRVTLELPYHTGTALYTTDTRATPVLSPD